MNKIAVIFTISIFATACAAPHQIRDRSDYLAEASREFPGETRERVIQAAETVLKISDPADFEFRHSMAGFTGLRRYVIYAVIAASNGREKWEFSTDVHPGGVKASISISEAGVVYANYSADPFERAMASVPLYRLFWSRVEYVLGRRNDWVTCDEAAAELEATRTNVSEALGGLCGPTSEGRNAPPPPKMTPLQAQPKQSVGNRKK